MLSSRVTNEHSRMNWTLSHLIFGRALLILPDLAEVLHSWARRWCWCVQFIAAHSPDQVKTEIVVLEVWPNLKLIVFFGFDWASLGLHMMTHSWVSCGLSSSCAVSQHIRPLCMLTLGWDYGISFCFSFRPFWLSRRALSHPQLCIAVLGVGFHKAVCSLSLKLSRSTLKCNYKDYH